MENWQLPDFSWTDLVLAALLLWGVYLLLVFVRQRLERGIQLGRWQRRVTSFISVFLLLYEPITVLILAVIFLFINPLVHGILLFLIVLASFSRIRDYLSGRIILFLPLIKVGKRMKTPKSTGVISRIGRIGLYLQTGDGMHFVNYSSLLTDGYSLVTGKDIGGYYQLNIETPSREKEAHPLRFLADKFVTTPYLDRTFKPELRPGNQENHVKARVSVREEKHLRELLDLLAEWGYPTTVAKK